MIPAASSAEPPSPAPRPIPSFAPDDNPDCVSLAAVVCAAGGIESTVDDLVATGSTFDEAAVDKDDDVWLDGDDDPEADAVVVEEIVDIDEVGGATKGAGCDELGGGGGGGGGGGACFDGVAGASAIFTVGSGAIDFSGLLSIESSIVRIMVGFSVQVQLVRMEFDRP